MSTRLATYEYKNAKVIGTRRLGFIIEDTPPASLMVQSNRKRVDLYGYTSMAVAGLKVQSKQIRRMHDKLERLQKQVEQLSTMLRSCHAR